MHPLYHHAHKLVGQHVYVHAYGRVHHGLLHQVTPEGLYLQRMDGAHTASVPGTPQADNRILVDLLPLAIAPDENTEPEQVWFPLLFLPWLAIAAVGPWWW